MILIKWASWSWSWPRGPRTRAPMRLCVKPLPATLWTALPVGNRLTGTLGDRIVKLARSVYWSGPFTMNVHQRAVVFHQPHQTDPVNSSLPTCVTVSVCSQELTYYHNHLQKDRPLHPSHAGPGHEEEVSSEMTEETHLLLIDLGLTHDSFTSSAAFIADILY